MLIFPFIFGCIRRILLLFSDLAQAALSHSVFHQRLRQINQGMLSVHGRPTRLLEVRGVLRNMLLRFLIDKALNLCLDGCHVTDYRIFHLVVGV